MMKDNISENLPFSRITDESDPQAMMRTVADQFVKRQPMNSKQLWKQEPVTPKQTWEEESNSTSGVWDEKPMIPEQLWEEESMPYSETISCPNCATQTTLNEDDASEVFWDDSTFQLPLQSPILGTLSVSKQLKGFKCQTVKAGCRELHNKNGPTGEFYRLNRSVKLCTKSNNKQDTCTSTRKAGSTDIYSDKNCTKKKRKNTLLYWTC